MTGAVLPEGPTGDPPQDRRFRLTPGPAILAVLMVVLVPLGLSVAETLPQYLFIGLGMPIVLAGAIARSGLPAYRTRLPAGVQIALAAVFIAVSLSVAVVDGRVQPAAFVWVFVVPSVFPATLPRLLRDRLIRSAERSRARWDHRPTGPRWQDRRDPDRFS